MPISFDDELYTPVAEIANAIKQKDRVLSIHHFTIKYQANLLRLPISVSEMVVLSVAARTIPS